MTLKGSDGPLLRTHDRLVLDLDGVVYVGDHAVPRAVESLTAAAETVTLRYVTNNASRTPAEVARHLRSLGLPVAPDDVVTSSQAAARLVRERVGHGAAVLAVGGPGVTHALEEAGLRPVVSAEDEPVAVVQGFGADVGWRELTEVVFAVRAGALWVATNTDATLPTARGHAPGNGALVAAVRAAVGPDPLVAGKPEPALFAAAAEGAGAPLAVGDRLDTDISAAHRAGIPALLVLTGVTAWQRLLSAGQGQRPDHVARGLEGLHEAHPEPREDGSGWRCGAARASVDGGTLRLLDHGDSPLDAVRARAAAAWEAADAGRTWDLDGDTAAGVDGAVGAAG